MMIFLTQNNDSSVISILHALFSALWEGLNGVVVPGFDFSFADVFLALFIAGLVGMILKALFTYFGSHLSDGNIKGKARGGEKPARRKGDE